MRYATFLIVALFAGFAGCQLSSDRPSPQWLTDFNNTDSIRIRRHDDQLVISDSKTIDRLRSIYENSEWKPYRHTLPGHFGDRTIDLQDGETTLRQFSYTGSLWETESYTENRTAALSSSDSQWIDALFARVPEGESPATMETVD